MTSHSADFLSRVGRIAGRDGAISSGTYSFRWLTTAKPGRLTRYTQSRPGTCPPDEIREYIAYDPDTGVFSRIKLPKFTSSCQLGSRADHLHYRGYRNVHFRQREYQGHRLAWFFTYGEWPDRLIDHINRDKADNRIANLRLCNASQNRGNAVHKERPLPQGVYLAKGGRFHAAIMRAGKKCRLGSYDTAEQAHAVYVEAFREFHGEFSRF